MQRYSTEHKYIEKLTATAPQPFYNVFGIFKNVVHVWNLVRRRVTRRITRLQTMYNILKYSKTGEKTMTFQFTGTAPEPEINSI